VDPLGEIRIQNRINGLSVVTLYRSAHMNIRRLLFVTLLAVSTVVLAADGLDVKTGLWEMTYTSDIQGSFVPQATLDQMTPAQKAQLAAAARKQAAQGPRTWTEKTCVTAKDLKAGAFRAPDDQDDPDCKFTMKSQTRTLQEGSTVCGGAEARRGDMKIEAQGRDRIKGSITVASKGGNLSMQLAGKWLSDSCAGADDD
jgi:hypothetical protein